ncbi:hypothetical protein [uncultured Enterococcus sp.]|uniref:hypothetical protein n=1 Tax=uncultured Enterococcus sp. TaxID=167972 RepID=UPI002AA93637|nr:hypothetical protein [uncultured Enterococcus sp.]
MKKAPFILLLSSLLLFTGCNTKNEKSISSSSSISSTASSSTLESSSSTSTSEAQIVSNSTSSVEQSVEISEESQDTTISEMTQEQALQRILDTYPEANDEDYGIIFWDMIDNDFLFKAYSKGISSQGGSGTIGFFRVSPQGDVYQTDATGTPF